MYLIPREKLCGHTRFICPHKKEGVKLVNLTGKELYFPLTMDSSSSIYSHDCRTV